MLHPGFTPQLHQLLPHFRIFQPVGTVDIPGIAGATRTATGFMVWQIRTGTRIVGLLGFPGDQAVFDIDFPTTRAGTVYTVRGTYHLIVLPALPVALLPGPVLIGGHPVAIGKGGFAGFKKPQFI